MQLLPSAIIQPELQALMSAASPQLPATLAQYSHQLLGLLGTSLDQQARAASSKGTVRGEAVQPQCPLPRSKGQAIKLELLSPDGVSSGLQAVNAAYKAVTGEDLPAGVASSTHFKRPGQQQQQQLVKRIPKLSLLVGPHHLRDLVRSSINVLLVQPGAAEPKLQAWGEVLGMGREQVLRWMGGMSMRSVPSRHPLVRDADELIDRFRQVGAALELPQAEVVQMVRSSYLGSVLLSVERASHTWAALSGGPFLQHPPWLEDWHAAAPGPKLRILSHGSRLSVRLEYLVQVGQQGSWSLGVVAGCSTKKWDERFPGYADHAEQLAKARGPAQPAVVVPNQAPEEVMQLINQQYQRVASGAQLPGKAFKGGVARRLDFMAGNKSEAAWMSTVMAMIEEVGLEATMVLVTNNPLIIFCSQDMLAEQLREYGQLTGWGRGQVLQWLQKPRCSCLLPNKPGAIINTARDYAAYVGLSEQEMLHLLDACPRALTSSIDTMKTGWSTLQELQASHPSWAQQWGGYSHSSRAMMAGDSLHRLRYLASTGQQGEVPMSTALAMSPLKFQSKFSTYAPPLTEVKEGRLGVTEAAQELQLRLDQCPVWGRAWQGLGLSTRQTALARARDPKHLGRLDYLLERALQSRAKSSSQVLWMSDKAWGAAHPEYAAWEQQRRLRQVVEA